MTPTMARKPAKSTRPETYTLLAVSPNQEDRRSLKSILDASGWTVQVAPSLVEAKRLMNTNPTLILCDRELPDGNWKDVFRQTERMANPPAVVVTARTADQRLWAEVLNLGGFDVLLKPFEKNEVTRVASMASRWFHAAAVPA